MLVCWLVIIRNFPQYNHISLIIYRYTFYSGGKSAMIYFYVPVSVLVAINIISFLSLMFNQNLMNCWKEERKNIRANRNQYVLKSFDFLNFETLFSIRMAIKLLFITGVPWVFEIAAWLSVFLSEGSVLGSNYVYIFEISNLLNSLRGVIIFIIFIVLQPNVRSYLLTQIFNKEIPVKNSSNQPASTTQTSEL